MRGELQVSEHVFKSHYSKTSLGGMGPDPEDDWLFKMLTVAVQSST